MAKQQAAFKYLPVSELSPDPEQPRTELSRPKDDGAGGRVDDSLAELTESIREHGIIEPLIVRRNPYGAGYIIVAGHRRHAAAEAAGMTEVPCLIVGGPLVEDGARRIVLQVVENIHRDNMSGLELAATVVRLKSEFGMSQRDIAKMLKRSEATISRWASVASPDVADYLPAVDNQPGALELFKGLDETTRKTALAACKRTGRTYTQQDIRKLDSYSRLRGPLTSPGAVAEALKHSLVEMRAKEIQRRAGGQQAAAPTPPSPPPAAPAPKAAKALAALSAVDDADIFANVNFDDITAVGSKGSLVPTVAAAPRGRAVYAGITEPDFDAADGEVAGSGWDDVNIRIPEFTVSADRAREILKALGAPAGSNALELGSRLLDALVGK